MPAVPARRAPRARATPRLPMRHALKAISDYHTRHQRAPLPTIEERFAIFVDEHLESGLLRGSQRQKLVRAADRAGIERFEANLIIASRQHRQSIDPAPDPTGAGWLLPVVIVATVQCAVIAMVAWAAGM